MFRRRKRVGAASGQDRKLHGRMIQLLYGHRNDSQVTNLGVYKTNRGRTLRAPH